MGVKNDKWIRQMSFAYGLIEPFEDRQVSENRISFGLSSYGYDMRLSNDFKIIKDSNADILLDPKKPDPALFSDIVVEPYGYCVIPPHSFVLGRSLEYFRIPRDILALCTGKSSYARSGVFINVTPLEPEWEGFVTISIANTGPFSVKLYAGEGIAQVIFMEAAEVCAVSYSDRKGKYQSQSKITMSKC